jgi:hypothetical protein
MMHRLVASGVLLAACSSSGAASGELETLSALVSDAAPIVLHDSQDIVSSEPCVIGVRQTRTDDVLLTETTYLSSLDLRQVQTATVYVGDYHLGEQDFSGTIVRIEPKAPVGGVTYSTTTSNLQPALARALAGVGETCTDDTCVRESVIDNLTIDVLTTASQQDAVNIAAALKTLGTACGVAFEN